jgi:hypothetical protein
MNKQITITNLTGTEPYNVYLCDDTYSGCVYIASIYNVNVPYTFLVPVSFETLTNVGVKVIDSRDCLIEGVVEIN